MVAGKIVLGEQKFNYTNKMGSFMILGGKIFTVRKSRPENEHFPGIPFHRTIRCLDHRCHFQSTNRQQDCRCIRSNTDSSPDHFPHFLDGSLLNIRKGYDWNHLSSRFGDLVHRRAFSTSQFQYHESHGHLDACLHLLRDIPDD